MITSKSDYNRRSNGNDLMSRFNLQLEFAVLFSQSIADDLKLSEMLHSVKNIHQQILDVGKLFVSYLFESQAFERFSRILKAKLWTKTSMEKLLNAPPGIQRQILFSHKIVLMPNTLTVYTTISPAKKKPRSFLIGICCHFCNGLKLSI